MTEYLLTSAGLLLKEGITQLPISVAAAHDLGHYLEKLLSLKTSLRHTGSPSPGLSAGASVFSVRL